jgi:hypothetical protein
MPRTDLNIVYKGDLVATVRSVSELKQAPTSMNPAGGFALVGVDSRFLPQPGDTQFNEKAYLATNPAGRLEVGQSKYTNGLDYYKSVGKTKEVGGIFQGTNINDVVTGFGVEAHLYGVQIDSSGEFVADDAGKLSGTVTFTNKSNGEIDTLVGSDAAKDEFHLGFLTEKTIAADGTIVIPNQNGEYPNHRQPTIGERSNSFERSEIFSTLTWDYYTTGKSKSLYASKGMADYAIVQKFGATDKVILSGQAKDYVFKSRGGNFEIYNSSMDLLSIVNNTQELQVGDYNSYTNITTLVSGTLPGGFDEDYYSRRFPDNVTPLIARDTALSSVVRYGV